MQAALQSFTQVPLSEQILMYNGSKLSSARTLASYKLPAVRSSSSLHRVRGLCHTCAWWLWLPLDPGRTVKSKRVLSSCMAQPHIMGLSAHAAHSTAPT